MQGHLVKGTLPKWSFINLMMESLRVARCFIENNQNHFLKMTQAYEKLSGFKSIRQIESRITSQKDAPFSKNNFCCFYCSNRQPYSWLAVINLWPYYKPMAIINDDSRVINKLEASLTNDARVVNYDRHMMIVEATGLTLQIVQALVSIL